MNRSTMLTQHSSRIRPAINGQLALASVSREQPDLIRLDIRIREMDGCKVCALLKVDKKNRSISAASIGALDNIEDKVKAFQVVVVDCITINTREHMAQSGTGLGLPIAITLIEKHGGCIAVSSELGVGSVLTAALPLVH